MSRAPHEQTNKGYQEIVPQHGHGSLSVSVSLLALPHRAILGVRRYPDKASMLSPLLWYNDNIKLPPLWQTPVAGSKRGCPRRVNLG
jgi:hypothetical protein